MGKLTIEFCSSRSLPLRKNLPIQQVAGWTARIQRRWLLVHPAATSFYTHAFSRRIFAIIKHYATTPHNTAFDSRRCLHDGLIGNRLSPSPFFMIIFVFPLHVSRYDFHTHILVHFFVVKFLSNFCRLIYFISYNFCQSPFYNVFYFFSFKSVHFR